MKNHIYLSRLFSLARLLLLGSLCSLSSCFWLEEKDPKECNFDVRISCGSSSWSIVDPDTYESILGYDKPINPDSIVITNTRGGVMYHKNFFYSDGWVVVDLFSPFDEITCFNQCESDSAFTRTYYMYVGNGDTDTIEAYFAAHESKYHLYFNGKDGAVPDDIPEDYGLGYSLFWFQKKIH